MTTPTPASIPAPPLTRRSAMGWLMLAGLTAPAAAHHGFTGRYDTRAPLLLSGRVAQASFSPPHPTIALVVAREAPAIAPGDLPSELTGPPRPASDLAGQTVEIEFPPVQAFYRLQERLRVGDEVVLIALRNCQPPSQLRSQWLRLGDGAVVRRDGRLAYMVDGCPG